MRHLHFVVPYGIQKHIAVKLDIKILLKFVKFCSHNIDFNFLITFYISYCNIILFCIEKKQ